MHMPVIATAAAVLVVAVAAYYAAGESFVRAAQPMPVIVDTDAGPDDLMAIAFLLASPSVRIEAVTIGTGLAHVRPGGMNVIRLLDAAGARDVPVYLGRETPLSGDREFPAAWRRLSDELEGVTLPPADRAPDAQPAAEFLARRFADADRPVDVLALGGLTNLAEAFAAAPAADRAIGQLVIMGGALRVPGNLADGGVTSNTTAEWNFYIDPEAARRVFASRARIRLIPLDATQKVPIDAAFVRALERAGDAPLARTVVQILGTVRDMVESGTFYAWDPLAAVALVDPSVVRFRRASVIVRQNPPEEGRTVMTRGGRVNAEVALDADATRFRERFLRALGGRR